MDTGDVEIVHDLGDGSNDALRRFALKTEPDKPLNLRPYQEELAAAGLAGENCIICAPTGSGKTHVSIAVIQDNLQKNPDGKVVFFVPTVDLVKQQCDSIAEHLGNRYRTKAISGGSSAQSNIPKKEFIEKFQIIVLTPAIFLNALCNDDEGERPLRFEDFSLLVFDECHHTDKGHPYNEIMVRYLDKKMENKIDGKLPQILGMTASLGTGKAKGVQDAHLFALTVCARMDAQRLCTVEKHVDDLEKYFNVPRDELVQVPSVKSHAFVGIIQSLMSEIEKPLSADLKNALAKFPSQNINADPPPDKFGPAYTTFVHANKRHIPVLHDPELKRKCISRLEHLEVYHNTLDVTAHVPVDFAFEYLEEAMGDKQQRISSELCSQLCALYAVAQNGLDALRAQGCLDREKDSIANKPEHKNVPLAQKLEEILVNEYRQRPESRTLVFVRTRAITQALKSFLASRQGTKQLNPGRLVGSNVSSQKGGQQSSVQKDTLAKFRTDHDGQGCMKVTAGEHKVLVVTTVAEEGLDIQTCNLVIKYNHVTNEIAMIQKRGRGRAEGSRSILLIQESKLAEKEMVNMVRETFMMEAIKRIQCDTQEKYRLIIANLQRNDYQSRQTERRMQESRRLQMGNHEFRLLCKKCDALCCLSTNVRKAQDTHYVCVDPGIWQRANVWSLGDKIDIFEFLTLAGRLNCAKCNNEWGIVVKYRNAYLPGLKADFMVFEKIGVPPDRKDARQTRKKWKQVESTFFLANPVESVDILRMIKADKAPLELDKAVERWKQERLRKTGDLSGAAMANGVDMDSAGDVKHQRSVVQVPVDKLIDI